MQSRWGRIRILEGHAAAAAACRGKYCSDVQVCIPTSSRKVQIVQIYENYGVTH